MVAGNRLRDVLLRRRGLHEDLGTFGRRWNAFWFIALVLFLLAIGLWYNSIPREPEWSLSSEGILEYPKARGTVVYSENPIASPEDKLVKVQFESRGATVYGLLRIPGQRGDERIPGIVLLPGAGVSKETEQRVASELAKMGYATLTIDQRGIGESKEKVGDISSNYEAFRQGTEPPLHKIVYDALRSYDLLLERSEIDPERVAFVGESMGGRTAIIAAALEPRSRGAVGISTGGYGLGNVLPSNNLTLFQRSIDPDAYIGSISPRKLLMAHSSKDNIVDIENADRTFADAKEPKRFVSVSCETHGYCEEMKGKLSEGLAWIFEK